MSDSNIVAMLEKMAATGHAPEDGCQLFGYGYEDAFRRLRTKYLEEWFPRGDSAEKFIIGPFGSGKTHFLRQTLEMARDLGCVTAEVPLTKDVDFTKSLLVFREVAQEIRAPGGQRGMAGLLRSVLEAVQAKAPTPEKGEQLARAWVDGLARVGFESEPFGRVARQAFLALLAGDAERFESSCRWLTGDVSDRRLCKELGVTAIAAAEQGSYGRRAMLSAAQVVRHGGFRGTVVGFDEAEQGLTLDRVKMQRVLSMLQSGINAVTDVRQASLLVLFALTPDIAEQMDRFPALQQRIADPIPGRTFLQGETLAPKIDLTVRGDEFQELAGIGDRLVALFFEGTHDPVKSSRQDVEALVRQVAAAVAGEAVGSGNRRAMVKRTCAMLLGLRETGQLADPGPIADAVVGQKEV